MTLKSYIWGMRITALFSIGALVSVVFFVDPEANGTAGKLLFYLVLFLVLSALFNLMLLRFRKNMTNQETAGLNIYLSFRQGMLLALLAVGLLILQSFRMLVWWDGLLLLAGIFLIELYFLSKN